MVNGYASSADTAVDMYPRLLHRHVALAIAMMAAICVSAVLMGTSIDRADAATSASSTAANAAQIDAYLAGKGSPMAGQGRAFVASGALWRVDPRLLVAISGAESSFGQITCGAFNAWGYGCPNNPYGWTSWADAIDTVAKGLRTNYLAEGRTTVALIQQKYAPSGATNDPTGLNNYWVANVSRFLLEQGGDPNNVDSAGVGGTRPLGLETDASSPGTDYAFSSSSAPVGAVHADPGIPARLTFKLRNDGTSSWDATRARVRRVDVEPYISSAPYAILQESSVVPGSVGTFTVDVEVTGTTSGAWRTSWRLEGPAGPVGKPINQVVAMRRTMLAASAFRITGPHTLGVGVRGVVIVHARNVGAEAWSRGGSVPVMLGIRAGSGPASSTDSWVSSQVPARLLERTVQPGEEGSFAFDIIPQQAGTLVMELGIFTRTGWAEGPSGRFSVEVR